jgi:uncharacterized protein YqeY
MTTLKQTLQADLTTAMRSGDADSLRTLRMVLTAISQAEVSGKVAHALTHDEEIAILTTELKRRRESAEAFAAAGRQELADAEVAEAAVISRYLPQPLTEEEVATLVASAVDQARSQGLEGGRAMGAVMKSLKADTTGRYDGAALAGMVKRELGLG